MWSATLAARVKGEPGRRSPATKVLGTDLTVTPPLHASGSPCTALRQDQRKGIGDGVGVCDCQADAGSRKIENSARPKRGILDSNPGIIIATAAGRSTAIAIIADPASDDKCKGTHVDPRRRTLPDTR
jgi:hypothetical protein